MPGIGAKGLLVLEDAEAVRTWGEEVVMVGGAVVGMLMGGMRQ